MSWATPLTADTAALAAGALAAGALVAGALAAGAGTWFAAPLDPGGGAGTLAAGAAGEEAALAAGAWLAGSGWPAELGWPAEAGWRRLRAGGWPAEDGPWLPPLPGAGVLPGAGEETLGRASHRTDCGCGAARQARREPADARGCGGAGGLRGAWILRGGRVLVG